MKGLVTKIYEGISKPSGLKKLKTTARTEKVHFKSGDVYDFSDPGYDEDFTYYDGSGNGYIKDKDGHVYDVIAKTSTGDAGMIAGGSTKYYVCIKKANGEDDFVVTGYIAVFSKGSNTECVSDIDAGYYLEDYIAKYYSEYSHGDKFKELAEKGDKNAKSYDAHKSERANDRKEEFEKRYLKIPDTIYFEVNEDGLEIVKWNPGNSKELEDAKRRKNDIKFWTKDDTGKDIKNPEWDKIYDEIKDLQKKADDALLACFKPQLVEKLSEVFKTKDINSLKGIAGAFRYEKQYEWGKSTKKSYTPGAYMTLCIDLKNNKVVTVSWVSHKVVDKDLPITLSDTITIRKKVMNEKMEKLFKKVAEVWKKTEGRKQTEYVQNNWERIRKDAGGYWSWNKTASQAKADAKAEFQKIVKAHDWNSYQELTFSLALVQMYVEGDLDPELGPVEKPLENPEPKGTPKETKVSGKAADEAKEKMTAWHEGRRKQNVGACSDAKLKMNHKICKELGYEKEAEELEKEAKKRGLALESLSMAEYAKAFQEIDE